MNYSMLIPAAFVLVASAHAQDFFNVTEATPANCLNVKTEYGAAGDDVTDDSAAFSAAIAAAASQGKNVFVPAGRYRISGTFNVPAYRALIGSTAGVTVLRPVTGSGAGFGLSDYYNTTVSGCVYENLFLDRVGFSYHTNRSNGMRFSRCVFFSSGGGFGQPVYLGNPDNAVIEDCVFMQSDSAPGKGISLYGQTRNTQIRRNLFGVDYGHMDWIAQSYPGNPNWSQLTQKLEFLRDTFGLGWDQGEFITCVNIGDLDNGSQVYDNVMNASPRRLGGSDHAIYVKNSDNTKFYRNWVRGWSRDAGGGVKFRDGSGYVIAANTLDDTGILLYSQNNARSDHLFLNNTLVWRNRLIERTNLYGWGTGIQYYQYSGTTASNNHIAANVFGSAPGTARISVTTGVASYDSNLYEGTSSVVEVWGGTAGTGTPPSAMTAPYDLMVAPTHDIPPFSLPPSVSPGSVALSQDVNANDIVYEVLAGGGNSGSNTFTYAITGGNGDGLFGIDPDTGEIFATAFIDHTTFAQRTLAVTVTDVNGVSTAGSVTLMPFVATVVFIDLGSLQSHGAYTDGSRAYNSVATTGLLSPATGAMGSQNGLVSAANVATAWNVDIAKTNTGGDEAMQGTVWTGAPASAPAPFTGESTALLSDGIYINNSAAVRVRFTGLNPSFTYNLAAFAALSGSSSTPSTFVLTTGTSASTTTQTLDVDQFPNGAVASWNAVQPDSGGAIAFTVTASGGTSGKRTELNAVRLEVLP